MSNELTDLRTGIDAAEQTIGALRVENRDMRRLLARLIGLAGKSELTLGDQEQLRQARRYLGEPEPDACHYCGAEVGHIADCPVPNKFVLAEEDRYAEGLPA